MRLLFLHDHKFRSIQGEMYSPGGLSDEALSRYTKFFSKVTIIARVIKEEDTQNKYSKIINKDVTIKDGKSIGENDFIKEVEDADFIISRMPSFFGLKGINLAKKKQKPYLIELVACPWDSLWNHSFRGKIIAPYMTFKTKKTTKEAAHVLYVTNEFLQKRYPTKGKSVSCSNVTLNEFDNIVLNKRLEKIEEMCGKVVIGTTAAIDVRFKGQQFIIEALGKLKDSGRRDFEYQLVGGGNNEYLKSVAKKYGVLQQVKFLGSKPHNEIFDWLQTIDIYAQPSQQEGLPRALIEAMSVGLPSIGAETGGIPELIEENFVFSNTQKNIQEICDLLINFNKNNMAKIAQRNYNESKNYEKNIIENKRSDFFKEFINDYKESKLI